ncbi:hypothetical protein C8P65_101163 [Capnocytophaga leadbetteri]|uniref:Uncharacterized protein n=1 Tax=Capnocytophaga leadbetteri TaxID=327575 RepID=A0A2T5XY88_9FLAO|nr:hypothetical protein [Capnocytophaga leadbetteri]PTX08498.1 hypothetical protein C8P65_101163 [Capnocytophaga leadbetteri]
MEITGKITGIEYKIELSKALKRVAIKDFDINTTPAACLVESKRELLLFPNGFHLKEPALIRTKGYIILFLSVRK